ncbi:MAG: hypothetical protein L6R30_18185 [Thermoanaerobaculia bacterium]|nr:hypothetical protein [Thermoanaerobaculia bacterium]
MREERKNCSFILAAVVAALLAAPAEAAVWYVPGVANANGRNDTHFSSDVKILNRDAVSALAVFELIPSGGEAPPPVSRPIAAGETFVSTNVLKSLWDFTGIGTLKITIEQSIAITARTYNDADPRGTFGTALTPLRHDDLLRPGETGHAPWISESPDSSRAFRTNAAVFLALPESAVDVVLFDAGGKEAGRTTVTGGPLLFQTSVSAIVPGGLPVGRAEFRVTAGKAAAYAAVVDNVTGDGIAVPAFPIPQAETSVTINGVARAPGKEGTFFRTDVRIFNPDSKPAQLQVTPLSAPALAAPVNVALNAGEVREIEDVLGALFSAPEGTTGSLLFTSAAPMSVMARTSNVSRDGTPGTYGAFQAGHAETAFLTPQSKGVLPGLSNTREVPGYRSNIGILAGKSGVTLRLTLKSRTGQTLGTNDSVSLPSHGWTQPGLDALFPGLQVPDDSVLEIVPAEGTADLYASIIDNATGDPVIGVADDFRGSTCALPEIYSLVATPLALEFEGETTVSWVTFDSDTVTLDGASPSLPVSGETPVRVSATRTLTLTAVSACGSSSKSLTVAVGKPSVTSSPSLSGSPGQLVTIQVSNQPAPSDITSLLLTFPDGATYRTDAYPTGGASVQFVVPLLFDGSSPQGYRLGSCELSLDPEGITSNAVSFTITPLSFAGDPVGEFRKLIDDSLNPLESALLKAQQVPELQNGFTEFLDTFRAYTALLRKAAEDLSAAPTTTLPVDLPSDEVPAPETVTLTREDLGNFVAVWRNILASAARVRPRRGGDQQLTGSCIAVSLPSMEACLLLQAVAPDDWALSLITQLARILQVKDDQIVEFLNHSLATLLNGYVKALTTAKAFCPALPVWLRNFIANPDRIPPGKTQKMVIEAYFESMVTSDALGDFISDQFTKRLLKKFASELPAKTRDKWIAAARKVARQQTAAIRQAIRNWLAKNGGIKSSSEKKAVGDCDLKAPRNDMRIYRKEIADFDGDSQGTDDGNHYYIKGQIDEKSKLPASGAVSLHLQPKERHFLFPITVQEAYENPVRGFRVPTYTLPLRVGRVAAFSISGISFVLYGGDPPQEIQRWEDPEPRHAVTKDLPFQKPLPSAFPGNSIKAATSDNLTYKVNVAGAAYPKESTFLLFYYSFLYKNPEGSLDISGGLYETYFDAGATIDGKTTKKLAAEIWSQNFRPIHDSFTMEESYEVANKQRLIGSARRGSSTLAYTFSPEKRGENPSQGKLNWRSGGPQGGAINHISRDSRSSNRPSEPAAGADSLYAATAGGIYESTDAGSNWTFLGPSAFGTHATIFQQSQSSPSTLAAGTWLGGVFISTDGGANWTQRAASAGLLNGTITSLAFDPRSANILFAGQFRGVYKTADGGATWTLRDTGISGWGVNSLSVHPLAPGTVYLASNSGLARSPDSAGSWSVVGQGTVPCARQVAADPSDASGVYARDCSDTLFRSGDGGATWTALAACSAGRGPMTVLQDGTLFAAAGTSLCKSTDRGTSWTVITTPSARAGTGLAAASGSSQMLYFATQDGILKSTNGGAAWTAANSGLNARAMTRVAIDPSNSQTVYGIPDPALSTTDGRIHKSLDGGTTWTGIGSQLPSEYTVTALAIDPRQSANVLATLERSGFRGRVFRSGDAGTSWIDVTPPEPASGGERGFYSIAFGGGASPSLFVVSDTYFHRSQDGGSSWASPTVLPVPGGTRPQLVADRKDGKLLLGLASNSDRAIFVSTDAGAAWTRTTWPYDRSAVYPSIASDPANEDILYSSGTMKTLDGGQTWSATKLGSFPRALITGPGIVYAAPFLKGGGGGGGIVRSVDGGETWTEAGGVFEAQGLSLSSDGGVICAATTGSGIQCASTAESAP